MLSYTDLTKGVVFEMDGEPYLVLEYNFLRMQQRKPTVQTKLKNLITGKIVSKSFQQSDSFSEAEIEKQPITFLYSSRKPARQLAGGEFWFCEKGNPKNRFQLKEGAIADQAKFLKPNTEVLAYKFGDKIINIELPVKMDYKVVEAPPSYKGDTATGGSKTVKLENGLTLNVPMFINEGDVIRVNTQTGEYVERAEKM
ncbi:MAG: elongation factor P [Candidatus Giovannonibacteria bacterium]|nr:MAG: elongation factor P [Candidatus Giovannonibacteria bacterium]